jgi:hypothetical protein
MMLIIWLFPFFCGFPEKKRKKIQLGVVTHVYNPYCLGSGDWRIMALGHTRQNI